MLDDESNMWHQGKKITDFFAGKVSCSYRQAEGCTVCSAIGADYVQNAVVRSRRDIEIVLLLGTTLFYVINFSVAAIAHVCYTRLAVVALLHMFLTVVSTVETVSQNM